MEKGKYYIGDLCYVIKGDNWDEVCSLTYPYTGKNVHKQVCLLYTSPSPRDRSLSRMPSSA